MDNLEALGFDNDALKTDFVELKDKNDGLRVDNDRLRAQSRSGEEEVLRLQEKFKKAKSDKASSKRAYDGLFARFEKLEDSELGLTWFEWR